MTLREYFEKKNSLTVMEMANLLGISDARVRQMRLDNTASPNVALKIERITQGAVNASDLSKVIAGLRA